MLTTKREMQNLLNMVTMTLIFIEPDASIGNDDMANHNHLYSDFAYSVSAPVVSPDSFAGKMMIFYDEEDD
jgi:hypothetical protein